MSADKRRLESGKSVVYTMKDGKESNLKYKFTIEEDKTVKNHFFKRNIKGYGLEDGRRQSAARY